MNDTPGRIERSPRRRLRRWALAAWLAASTAGVTVAYLGVDPSYNAYSQVNVRTEDLADFTGGGRGDFDEFMRGQADLIRNPLVIGMALSDDPGLSGLPMLKGQANPVGRIDRALRVRIVPRSTLINIEMSSPSPGEAARVVNAVVGSYLKHTRAIYERTSRRVQIDRLEKARDEQRSEVAKQRALVRSLADEMTSASDKDKLLYARRDLQRGEEVIDRIDSALYQLKFDKTSTPAATVELAFRASPSPRPDFRRRRHLMEGIPAALGLLVFGPVFFMGRRARPGEPAPREAGRPNSES